MRLVRNAPLLLDGPAGPNNRRFGRVRCDNLRCFFTDRENDEAAVVDLSLTGARVRVRHKLALTPGASERFLLLSPAGSVPLEGKVVWAKRRGFWRYELGIAFSDPTPETRQKLAALMRTASDSYTVYSS